MTDPAVALADSVAVADSVANSDSMVPSGFPFRDAVSFLSESALHAAKVGAKITNAAAAVTARRSLEIGCIPGP